MTKYIEVLRYPITSNITICSPENGARRHGNPAMFQSTVWGETRKTPPLPKKPDWPSRQPNSSARISDAVIPSVRLPSRLCLYRIAAPNPSRYAPTAGLQSFSLVAISLKCLLFVTTGPTPDRPIRLRPLVIVAYGVLVAYALRAYALAAPSYSPFRTDSYHDTRWNFQPSSQP